MTHDSMISWVQNILIPYVSQKSLEMQNEDLYSLIIFDGLKVHIMDDEKFKNDKMMKILRFH